jgi:lysophospholipase L1-like esterase
VTLGRIGRTAIGLACAAAVFLAFGELVARATDIVDRLNGYSRQLFTKGPSPALPYLLRPHVETVVYGVAVRVNALGLRGPEQTVEPAPGVFRVLAVGDSVMFGQGVEEDQALPAVLARRLATVRGDTVEVLNAGVQGYDVVAEAAFLVHVGLGLHPHVVVVGTSLNDCDAAPGYDPTGVLTWRRDDTEPPVLARSEFLLVLRWLVTWARGQLPTQLMAKAPGLASAPPQGRDLVRALDRANAEAHRRFYAQPEPVAWARMRRGYEALRDTAARAGVPLLVAIFPEGWQLGPDGDRTPQTRLLGLCADVGITCLDLLPAFDAAPPDGLFQDTQHPSARGFAIAADAIAAALPR